MTRASAGWSGLILVLAALLARGGAAEVPIGTGYDVAASSVRPTIVPFVSVRAIEQDREGHRFYGSERGETTAGNCTVDLGVRKKRQIIGLQQIGIDQILDALASSDDGVVIYVHGYNVSFERSCRDAAMLQNRVGLDGRLLLFSWSAEGKVASYLRDVGNMQWSVPLLEALLVDLEKRVEPMRTSVIGHSLGARGVVETLEALEATPERTRHIGRVILIAPDVDRGTFVRDFGTRPDTVSSITLYVSGQDRALKASRNIADQPRVGEGSLDFSKLDGIDVVEVRQPRWRFTTGHNYYLTEPQIFADLRAVLTGPPRQRGSRTIAIERN
jgi:esterase/lipase superfamily enzyme